MKRFLSVILAICLLFSIGGCTEKKDETTPKLAEQLKLYMTAQENLYAPVKAVYEKADAFCNTKNWEDLSAAVVAASAAEKELSKSDGVETILSEEELAILADKGMDVSYLPQTLENVAVLYENEAVNMKGFLDRLCENIYTEVEFELLGEMVALKLDEVQTMAEYACTEISYFACDMEDEALTGELKAHLEGCDVLSDGMGYWCENTDDALEKIDIVLDELENIITMRNNNLGKEEGISQQYQEHIKKPVEFNNMPLMLPLPDWYNTLYADVSFSIVDGANATFVNEYDEDSFDKVTGVVMFMEGVSVDEVTNYLDAVTEMGYSVLSEKNEDGVVAKCFASGSYAVEVGFNGERAYISLSGEKICFAPLWYLAR